MTYLPKSATSLPLALVALSLLISAFSADALAGERSAARAGTHTAAKRDVLRQRDSGTYTSNTTRTGPNGQVSTRSTTGVLDKEAGTWSRDTTATGPNGKTRTVEADVTKTDNGYVRDVSRTGPNGKTTTVNTVGVVDKDNGTATRTTTLTKPDGQTATSVTTKTFVPAP